MVTTQRDALAGLCCDLAFEQLEYKMQNARAQLDGLQCVMEQERQRLARERKTLDGQL